MPSLKANVDVALSMCERVLEKTQQLDQNDEQLVEKREERKKEWARFIEEMNEKCQRVDETFACKEREIEEFYTDLEKKLKIVG